MFTVPGGAAGSGWGLGSGLRHYQGSVASWDPLSRKSNCASWQLGPGSFMLLPPGEGQMTTESSSNSTASLFKQGSQDSGEEGV